MRKILLIVLCLEALIGCNKTNTPAPIIAVVQAAQGVICPLAQEYADELGSKLVALTGGSNGLACGGSLYQPLINSQICQQPISSAASPQLKAMAASHPEWTTIGDIPKSAIDAIKAKSALKNEGVISSVACPLGIGVIMGVVSANIPTACQGPNSLSSSSVDAAAVQVCQILTAALP